MDDSVDEPSDHKNTVDEDSMYELSDYNNSYLDTYDMTAILADTTEPKPPSEHGNIECSKPHDLILHLRGHRIPVYRNELMVNSEYFKRMLVDYKDATEVYLEFDVEVDVFRLILDYIRYKEIELTIDNVKEITKCARYFMLDELLLTTFEFKAKHFELIFKNGTYLGWTLTSMQQILRSDRVIVSDEKKMLTFAVKWLNYEFDLRRKNAAEVLYLIRFSFLSKEHLSDTIGKFVIGVPPKLLTKTSPPRQYHKGIYVLGRSGSFQRYCPIDGSVTVLEPPHNMTSFKNPQLISNGDKIYIFEKYTTVKSEERFTHHIYDALKDSWCKESTMNHEVVSFFNRNPFNFSMSYCSFGSLIYAFVKCLNKVKVFILQSGTTWVANSQSQITLSGVNSRSPVQSVTACGGAIYVVMAVTTNILRYSPANDEWDILPTPYELGTYNVVAHKNNLFFSSIGHKISFDITTNQIKEYLCPRIGSLPHATLYNSAIYMIADETDSSMDGLNAFEVQKLDPSFMNETISLVGPQVPFLITDISKVEQITSIY